MSRRLWIAFCVFAALVFANALVLLAQGVRGYLLLVVLPLLVLGLLSVYLLRARLVVYSYAAAAIIGAYGAQAYVLWSDEPPPMIEDKFNVVQKARGEGIDAVPSVHPLVFVWKDAAAVFERWDAQQASLPVIDDRAVLPLAGISGATTYYCKEADPFLVFESDRYGFNNPDEVWDRPIEVVLLGDSFTQGACVPTDQHVSHLLRESRAGVLNLGMGGNGPLAALATLQEYVSDLRPRHVFWLYFEANDVWLRRELRHGTPVSDLETELTLPILVAYLQDPAFRQGLAAMQPEIDAVLRSVVETAFAKELAARDQRAWSWRASYRAFAEQVVLAPLAMRVAGSMPPAVRRLPAIVRGRIRTTGDSPAGEAEPRLGEAGAREAKPEEQDLDESMRLVRAILARMDTAVAAWGGELHLVYLPDVTHFRFGVHPLREEMLALAEEMGIGIVDLLPVFEGEADPLRLFAFGERGGHYNGAGYRHVAETIAAYLSERDSGDSPLRHAGRGGEW